MIDKKMTDKKMGIHFSASVFLSRISLLLKRLIEAVGPLYAAKPVTGPVQEFPDLVRLKNSYLLLALASSAVTRIR